MIKLKNNDNINIRPNDWVFKNIFDRTKIVFFKNPIKEELPSSPLNKCTN